VTATLESTATPSAIENNNLAEAFAEIAGLIAARAHLPAITYAVGHPSSVRPRIDLWVAEPGHVAGWAATFDHATTTEHPSTSSAKPFTVTDATIHDLNHAELTFTNLRYHDAPVD
jgi:hypothetical protein